MSWLLGIQLKPWKFYPFGCKVTALMARHKNGAFGAASHYIFLGYSQEHNQGYLLYNQESNKIIVRGDIHSLMFYPEILPWKEESKKKEKADRDDLAEYDGENDYDDSSGDIIEEEKEPADDTVQEVSFQSPSVDDNIGRHIKPTTISFIYQ